ncbi:MAG: hypothetical protein IJC62_01370 [Clostridia bacterium]|nr:hypothetical protein [Clostridia bacterium]
MKDIIKAFDNLPLIVKIILALPGIAIIWQIYRLIKSLNDGNVLGIILAIVLLVAGPTFFWIIDLVCIILKGNVWWF